jgi:altronate hydrolase
MTTAIRGYLRPDRRKGIRNYVIVAYLVECAHHVAREIMTPFREQGVQLIGFPGCFPNAYADRIMRRLCTHPNVAGVLLLSLGCESFDRRGLANAIRQSGRQVDTIVIQENFGTRRSIQDGRAKVRQMLEQRDTVPRVEVELSELIVGTICGGSDATSGLTANPVIGKCFDLLGERGATCIFEETGELIGCEHHMATRAATSALGREIIRSVAKAEEYYRVLGHGSFAPGNAAGGLTTQEEKSLGAYAKSGTAPIAGLIKPGDIPPGRGLYLLDVVPDGPVRFGFPNVSDNAEAVELAACGAHLILFSTGRGSVVGGAIAPIVKVCANPDTYRKLSEDMDIDAGAILEGRGTVDSIGRDLLDRVARVASGEMTASEALGHQEFILGYKHFEPTGPSCLPVAASESSAAGAKA